MLGFWCFVVVFVGLALWVMLFWSFKGNFLVLLTDMLITGVGLIVDAIWASMGIVNLGWVSVIQLKHSGQEFLGKKKQGKSRRKWFERKQF